MRELPLRTKKPKQNVEEDEAARARTVSSFPLPGGGAQFRDGYRECVELFALHRPNRRGVLRILDSHCVILEEACIRAMTRENVARYEGFRQALKDVRRRC
jgi:hypothetical protein